MSLRHAVATAPSGPCTILLALAATTGCAGVFGTAGGAADSEARMRSAVTAADEGRFRAAIRELRELAARCESGERGPDAVLFLAALEIDPRNPRPSPAAAAQLAARYLQTRRAAPSSLAVAESLYLLALDLGGSPVGDPFASVPAADSVGDGVGFWRVAPRFAECDADAPRSARVELPEHPGMPLWRAMESAYRQRDSLAAGVERLRLRADSLESELERVRSLLEQIPDPPPSGREP